MASQTQIATFDRIARRMIAAVETRDGQALFAAGQALPKTWPEPTESSLGASEGLAFLAAFVTFTGTMAGQKL